MALEFTSDPPADSALTIRFDLRGVHDLLAAMQGAVVGGSFTIGGGEGPAAIGAVTFTFADWRDDRPAGKTPAPPLVLEPAD